MTGERNDPAPGNDCFALPPGVAWTPVDQALALLRERLGCVTGVETVPLTDAAGRILADAVSARRANPPVANAAVDGYAFAHADAGPAPFTLPLAPGRSAAGHPLDGPLPKGHAVRILTGAPIPDGADTVAMQEDATVNEGRVTIAARLKPGANLRPAGEDISPGRPLFAAGHRLAPQDLALLAAGGVGSVAVRRRLRVGVLSTGDEIVPPGASATDAQIFDANRPMLLALLAAWGMEAVDLGHVRDDRDLLRRTLDEAARRCDAVLTSGGASAGDEDHLSALLNAEGRVHSWRIAVKPGRPLALGQWRGVPLFGLPGNPVAAFVTALIFARPALGRMAGAGWWRPRALTVPAAFAKSKKAGRREFLRARLDAEGRAETFRSEGSGLVSGLVWAGGLVELPDEAVTVRPGDPVRFLPFSAFDLPQTDTAC